jgi:ribosomal peptide maturation radical SAM protein 1
VSKADVILVAMPWQALNRTPIQLGILQEVLRQAGYNAQSRSYYLAAAEHFTAATAHLPAGERITIADCEKFAYKGWDVGLADWIFAVPPYHEWSAARDEEYFAFLRAREMDEQDVAKAVQMRQLVPAFLECCAADILAQSPKIVGFTSSFSQNVPALALSKLLKQHDPSLFIVFGGANCDGSMGAALHRSFDWVDAVVRGEGEHVLTELTRDVLAGGAVNPQPGLCYRVAGESVAVEQTGGRPVLMNEVPPPNYDEYFARLERSPFRSRISDKVVLCFESARGCWWGEKMHCTFCGLNGSSMKFRSKSAAQVIDEIYTMATKYRQVDFEAVDNIIDMRYMQEFLPQLRDLRRTGLDFTFFYETKSNLKKDQLRLMRDAGLRHIQPGIESISNSILKLMRKGVTGLQNIRLLKWAQQYGISVVWNIIYGFPGEPVSEYERMAEVLPSLTHLAPPMTTQVMVERFSPYFQNPEAFGLTALKPAPFYRYLYHVDEETLNELAYDFTHEYMDGRAPYDYARPVIEFAERWIAGYAKGGSTLTYRRGPGFIIINDRRFNLASSDYILGETEAAVYLACDEGATPAAIAQRLRQQGQTSLSVGQIKEFLAALREARLVYEEDGRYLSLAVALNAEVEDATQTDEQEETTTLVQIGRTEGVLVAV